MIKSIAGVGVAALLLTGCGASSEPAPTVTVTATQEPVLSQDDAYLADLSSTGDPLILAMDEAGLLEIGHSTCELLNQGTTITELAVYLVNNGNFTTEQYATIGRILGSAVYDICPEYSYQISDLSNSY